MQRTLKGVAPIALAVMLAGAFSAAAASKRESVPLGDLARQAVSGDEGARAEAIAGLRAAGRDGLDALFQFHQRALNQVAGRTPAKPDRSDWELLRQALDAVGGQRDCYASHLYWYTDLSEAKMAAARERKPILSLRMLGKLTDELSCANSRFFRAALYSNAEVSQVLRDRFILHWQSVRPVPIVTIDFGDGRKLERTVTGNSIHYILNAYGQPLDALPGMYGPKAFLRGIERAEQLAKDFLPAADRVALLKEYHQKRLAELDAEWAKDQALAAMLVKPAAATPVNSAVQTEAADDLSCSGQIYYTDPPASALISLTDPSLHEPTSDKLWDQIALLHAEDARLDPASNKFIARQKPNAAAAGALAVGKALVENPLVRMISNFQQSVSLDTVRNEYLLHRQIHSWFASGQVAALDRLNERVYADLFLTPSTDPWLGLLPADTYSALQNGGAVVSSVKK